MADYAVQINLLDHKLGDKWPGIPNIGPVLVNGYTPVGSLARIRAWFVHESGLTYKMDSDSGQNPDAPIVISNSATWVGNCPEIMEFLPLAGCWTWDMEFWEGTDTAPMTFYKGTITVLDDTTK